MVSTRSRAATTAPASSDPAPEENSQQQSEPTESSSRYSLRNRRTPRVTRSQTTAEESVKPSSAKAPLAPVTPRSRRKTRKPPTAPSEAASTRKTRASRRLFNDENQMPDADRSAAEPVRERKRAVAMSESSVDTNATQPTRRSRRLALRANVVEEVSRVIPEEMDLVSERKSARKLRPVSATARSEADPVEGQDVLPERPSSRTRTTRSSRYRAQLQPDAEDIHAETVEESHVESSKPETHVQTTPVPKEDEPEVTGDKDDNDEATAAGSKPDSEKPVHVRPSADDENEEEDKDAEIQEENEESESEIGEIDAEEVRALSKPDRELPSQTASSAVNEANNEDEEDDGDAEIPEEKDESESEMGDIDAEEVRALAKPDSEIRSNIVTSTFGEDAVADDDGEEDDVDAKIRAEHEESDSEMGEIDVEEVRALVKMQEDDVEGEKDEKAVESGLMADSDQEREYTVDEMTEELRKVEEMQDARKKKKQLYESNESLGACREKGEKQGDSATGRNIISPKGDGENVGNPSEENLNVEPEEEEDEEQETIDTPMFASDEEKPGKDEADGKASDESEDEKVVEGTEDEEGDDIFGEADDTGESGNVEQEVVTLRKSPKKTLKPKKSISKPARSSRPSPQVTISAMSDLVSLSEEQMSVFLRRDSGVSQICRKLMAKCYAEQTEIEFGQKFDGKFLRGKRKGKPTLGQLPKLDVSDVFGSDQLWEEFELRNKALLGHIGRRLHGIEKEINKKTKEVREEEGMEKEDGGDEEGDEMDVEGHAVLDDSEKEKSDGEESEEESTDEKEEEALKSAKKVRFASDVKTNDEDEERHEIDDGFFSVADMEKFAGEAEALAMDGKLMASDDDDDDNESGEESEEEDDDDDEAVQKEADYRYSDFFDAPTKVKKGSAAERRAQAVRVMGNEEDAEKEVEEEEEEVLTPFQVKRKKQRRMIEAYEEESVSKKSWELRGEVDANSRPKDSLLDTAFEHETTGKAKMFLSSEMNAEIEKMIKQRIVDGLFDDVIPTVPAEIRGKKKEREVPEVSQEKPTEGLADLYAREYMEELEKKEKEKLRSTEIQKEVDEVTEEQEEVTLLYEKLCKKLDALSSMHFTPVPEEEVKTEKVANARALQSEEAVPDAVSDGDILTAREVYSAKKKDQEDGKELSKQERKRKRRRRKERAAGKKRSEVAVENDAGVGEKRKAKMALERRGKKMKVGEEEDAMSVAEALKQDKGKGKRKRKGGDTTDAMREIGEASSKPSAAALRA